MSYSNNSTSLDEVFQSLNKVEIQELIVSERINIWTDNLVFGAKKRPKNFSELDLIFEKIGTEVKFNTSFTFSYALTNYKFSIEVNEILSGTRVQ